MTVPLTGLDLRLDHITALLSKVNELVNSGVSPSGDAILDSVLFNYNGVISIPAGQNDNWDPGIGKTFLTVATGLGGSTLTGMIATRHAKGTIVIVANAMPGAELLIKHMSPSSLADNRFCCAGERDIRIPSGGGCIMHSFGPGNGVHGWRVISVASTSFQTFDAKEGRLLKMNLGGSYTVGIDSQLGYITPPALSNGANHNYMCGSQADKDAFNAAGRIRMVPGAGSTLSGMVGINDGVLVGDVKVVEVFAGMTFKHQDAGSNADRRFYLPNAADLVFAGNGTVTFLYENNQYWWPISVCK